MKTVHTDTANQIVWIHPKEISKSPLNPRTHFDPEKIEELISSFREHGFAPELSHLLLRPANNEAERTKYEIVCGHRRWVAASQMGLDKVPAVVRPMTDARVVLIQLVENLQREGLTPLEEAEGYRAALEMRDDKGAPLHTSESLAKLVGKTRQTVEDRVRLCRLRGTFAGQVLESGELPVSHARLLSRIPSPAQRDQIAKRVLTPPDGMGPMHYRQLERLIHDECMVQLRGAEFPQDDASLVPVRLNDQGERVAGGACTDCPFNTRNMESTGSKFHMCLNVECFRDKRVAAHARWMATETNAAANRTALPLADSEKLFDLSGSRLAYNSGFVDLDEAPPEHDLKRGVQNPPAWKKLVRGRGVPVVVVKDGHGKVRELADHKIALEAARENDAELPADDQIFRHAEKGAKKGGAKDLTAPLDPEDQSPVEEAANREIERKREKAEELREKSLRVLKAEFEAVVSTAGEKARAGEFKAPGGFWGAAVALMIDVTDEHGDAPSVAAALGVESAGDAAVTLRKFAQRIQADAGSQVAFFMRLLLHFYAGEEQLKEGLKSWAKVMGVNLGDTRAKELVRITSEKVNAEAAKAIKNRVTWKTRKESPDDFDWNASGCCTNADEATASIQVGYKASVLVARMDKGWVWSAAVHGKNSGFGSLPKQAGTKYGSREAALRAGLLQIEDWCQTQTGMEKSVKFVREYIAQMGIEEPKKPAKKTAPKPKTSKPKTKPAKKAKKGGAK